MIFSKEKIEKESRQLLQFFNQPIGQQIWTRVTRDYYDPMLAGVVYIIVILLLLPQIQNVALN